ncbi:MAG: N-substituted formamide deformylase [Chlorobi bacterium]|nr:N-substituted formamide deformylase [Chlorobiota bacterium]
MSTINVPRPSDSDFFSPKTVRCSGGIIDGIEPSERFRLFLDGREMGLPPGAMILPGLVDTHCHLIGIGLMASRVGLRGAASAGECAERVAERVRATAPGEWIVGFGWNQEEWTERRMPDRATLDRLIADHPVALYRIDSHAVWLNGRALLEAGITPQRIDGGSIELDERGEPTGILIDNAMKLVDRAIPPPTVERQRGWIEESVGECLRLGITEVHDMNVEPERLESMTRAADRGGMRLRCQVFLAAQNEEWAAVPRPVTLGPNLHIVGVKYFADGALGSRGALLLEPYSDAPGTRGLQLLDAGEIVRLASEPLRRGFAVATHAIGDGANRIVLDAYAELRAGFPESLLRMEHAQTVHPADVPRFAAFGVIPAMQPTHCTSDAAMAEARLGPERCGYAYGWRSMLGSGVPILGGSDFPIESPDPLEGLRAFHFRRPAGGAEAWHPGEVIPRADAVAAYTAWAPLGIPGDHHRGRILPGADADIVVLSGNPFDDPGAAALLTIVGGEVVYRS